MKNLNEMGVQEMNAKEMNEENGGGGIIRELVKSLFRECSTQGNCAADKLWLTFV